MAAEDTFNSYREGLSTPLENAFDVTPNDGTDIAFVTRALHIGVGGDIRVTFMGMADGDSVLLKNIAGGAQKAWRVKRVWAADLTADSIVGQY
ncbi:MAG: hypothetical protein KAR39_13410 [Thermoplasmata archaeon]|nr:hypothetical protein [Thermoplasmata archaeon]